MGEYISREKKQRKEAEWKKRERRREKKKEGKGGNVDVFISQLQAKLHDPISKCYSWEKKEMPSSRRAPSRFNNCRGKLTVVSVVGVVKPKILHAHQPRAPRNSVHMAG